MDGLRLMKGVPRLEIAVRRDVGVCGSRLPAKVGALACGGSAMETSSASDPASVSSRQSYVFPLRMMLLWPGGRGGGLMEKGSGEAGAEDEEKREEAEEVEEAEEEAVVGEKRGNWVQNILRVGSIWPRKEEAAATDNREEEAAVVEKGDVCVGAGCAHGIVGCVVGGEAAERMAFDRESFSRFLRRVTLAEARLFGKMAYLCSLAYIIPKIKPKGLLKRYALRFVTSSFDRRGKSSASDKKQTPVQDQELEEEISRAEGNNEKSQNSSERKENGTGINDFVAYRIAASAASYLQSKTIGILPFNSAKSETSNDPTEESGENEEKGTLKSLKEVSFVATTNSVTAVVAGKEEMKDAVAKDLNSAKNSPCEWYICDDDSSSTRFFVIQGSESLASWQANLLFEPIQFEGLDVLVHRGIYEVAKGMYQQMLPEIKAHLESHGDSATLRFTGHSLGGSLALLLNLMLIIRGEAPALSLLPVITFGSPSIMCGGDSLLHKLGLPRTHVQAITMHRDIVPRAFSCHYPDHVAKILKAVNHNFRRHPCLMKQKLLYAPMGRLLILQPEDEFSPHHHLLPPGSGLYVFGNSSTDSDDSERLLQAARSAFINSPHPLEILSDRTAYGSAGAVSRDHDMRSYLTSVRAVIRHELILIRKVKREQCRRKVWWPLLITVGTGTTKRHSSFSSFFPGERNQ
ncbi:Lipase (class 3) [Musa troglodytarum]|uniref:Lipase (Class 3) n=1 Tax=Musa troglodytarum TaxID=320322 RepID=A0A9E7EIZ4_9LILI|nr:Lipase (class 3) [Musa troglodytarum]